MVADQPAVDGLYLAVGPVGPDWCQGPRCSTARGAPRRHRHMGDLGAPTVVGLDGVTSPCRSSGRSSPSWRELASRWTQRRSGEAGVSHLGDLIPIPRRLVVFP